LIQINVHCERGDTLSGCWRSSEHGDEHHERQDHATRFPQGCEPTVISIKPAWISFGGTAAIVTSMGLILGLDASESSRQAIVGVLLIVALADNLSDSLSVHVYQEAEQLESREAFRSTLANFATRLLVALSFVVLAIALPRDSLATITVAWGLLLLVLLTYWIARTRGARIGREIAKHIAVAAIVLVVSRWLGTLIAGNFG
jgi:VIT1/CCC1 family predicted Fe2+/Mn2+ transporter